MFKLSANNHIKMVLIVTLIVSVAHSRAQIYLSHIDCICGFLHSSNSLFIASSLFLFISLDFRPPSEVLASLPFFPENVEVSAMAYCLGGNG